MSERLLTVDEFAQRTHQHAQTVRRHIRMGDVPTVRTGRKYLIPESVATNASRQVPPPTLPPVEALWEDMTSGDAGRHNAALRALFSAPDDVKAQIMERSATAAAAYYVTPEGDAELADWRSLDGEPVQDDDGDYYSAEEEAKFRAEREAAR